MDDSLPVSTVTLAPGMIAPLGSSTTPVITPPVIWANAVTASHSHAADTPATGVHRHKFLVLLQS